MVIGTLPELTSLLSESYTTDKRHAVNWTKVQLMSSCLQVYLVMVQQLDNTLHGLGLLTWSDSLIPFNYTTCTIRVTNSIINMKACLGGSCISLQGINISEDLSWTTILVWLQG